MKLSHQITIITILTLSCSAFSQSWKKQPFAKTHTIQDVHFIDSTIGFAAGENAIMYRSNDGGITWDSIIKLNKLNRIFDIHFSKNYNNYGWVTGPGASANLYWTQDAGNTWTSVNVGIVTNTTLKGIHVPEITPSGNINGWCVGVRNNTTWIARENSPENKFSKVVNINNNPSPELNSIHSTNYQNAVAVGNNGLILHSGVNPGDAWYPVASGTTQNIQDVFLLGTRGWAVGNYGTYLTSTNNGLSWVKKEIKLSSIALTKNLNGIYFTDQQTGWIVGDDGLILRTIDGGNSWIKEESATLTDLLGLYFIDNNNGWAVGDSGIVLKYSLSGPNAITLISSDTTPCLGTTINIQATTPIQDPVWTLPNGDSVKTAILTLINIQSSDNGKYELNGKWNGQDVQGAINISILPLPSLTAAGAQLACDGKPVDISAIGNGSFTWTGPNGFLKNGATVPASLAGIYTVTLTDVNGCTNSISVEVKPPANAPKASIQTPDGKQLTCAQKQLPLQGGSDKPNVTYEWSRDGAFYSSKKDTIAALPGQYRLRVREPISQCTGDSTITISESKAAPTIQWLVLQDSITCTKKTALLSVSSNGMAFSWQGPGVNGQSGPQLSPDRPGTYTLTVTGSNGCSVTTSAEVKIDTTAPVILDTEIVVSDCTKDLHTLEAEGLPMNGLFQWYDTNGTLLGTSPSVTVQGAGTYTIRLTASNGCMTVAEQVVQPALALEPPTIITPNGDGKNDRLEFAFCGQTTDPISLTILNRWGQVIHQINDYRDDWPQGNSADIPSGQYYYIMEYQGDRSKHPLTILKE